MAKGKIKNKTEKTSILKKDVIKKTLKEKLKIKKEKSTKKPLDKKLKILKYISYALAVVLLVEGIYFGIKIYNNRKDTTYYSAITNMIENDDQIIAVGLSDSKHSKTIKYESPGYNKPYIWVYNKDFNILKEIRLNIGYNGIFTDIKKVEDGYIVVGYSELNEYQQKNSASEGIIVKYDENFNVVWKDYFDLLGVTRFNSLEVLEDGSILVAGASIYEPSVIGNHTNGGAIVVKYSSDGDVLWSINHGGPKAGEFNDLILVDDGFIVVGVKSGNTGIIFKYNYAGKELWHNYYGYCDTKGLTSITKLSNNEYIVTGSKLDSKEKTDNYKAVLLKYNAKGSLVGEEVYQKDEITRFENSFVIDDMVMVLGIYGKKVDNILENDTVLLTYNKSLEKENEVFYDGNNSYTLTEVIVANDYYILGGYTDSKIKDSNIKTNGLDYYPLLVKVIKK